MAAIPFGPIYLALAVYTLTRSTVTNFFLLSLGTLLAKIFYNAALYPAFFTPMKNIPSPAVSSCPILIQLAPQAI